MSKHHYSYLALGDSYTIGESVPLHESFPYQAVQLLRKQGSLFHAPEIVAKTGWTSFELAEHILHTRLDESYDFVTLLIGVNNQYRGLPQAEFRTDFEFLLRKAIHLAGELSNRVIVLSVPDWGITPFADKKDRSRIASEIDAFNRICEAEAGKMHAHFIDITADTRKAANDRELLASDKLHYSGKAHMVWAEKVARIVQLQLHR
ncbi:SGNH/GDSL hydrolase family protein [Sediminibacterium soli]|uniref:SGNH/GDSL hydrolase family protein n=1 Tax=Sediminibacterium soli TaxID=2698829 RepID=UPI001379720C|nr:SGNH/GDSL hydrolase family protein [Sediminibacterium soli]NCI46051.1 SGNH/GDSL hydrolase family protein [Sediminibacterium soli]